MSVMPCVAKHAVDPPLQPATPNVTDWDRKWAKLEWWAPQASSCTTVKNIILVYKAQNLMLRLEI